MRALPRGSRALPLVFLLLPPLVCVLAIGSNIALQMLSGEHHEHQLEETRLMPMMPHRGGQLSSGVPAMSAGGLSWPAVKPLPREVTVTHNPIFGRRGCADDRRLRSCHPVTFVTPFHAKTKDDHLWTLLRNHLTSVAKYAPLRSSSSHSQHTKMAVFVSEHLVVCSAATNVSAVAAMSPHIRAISELTIEPMLKNYPGDVRFDEYCGDGKLRSCRGRVVQMVVKLAIARHVKTSTYVILDADCALLRPATACDFGDAGRAVASFSPAFSSHRKHQVSLIVPKSKSPLNTTGTGGLALRSIGQYGRWLRWSAEVLGIESLNASDGFYGVTPAVLNVELATSLLDYLERRFGGVDWWIRVPRFFTEYGLYFAFAEASGLVDAAHIRCEGQLYSASLWQDTPAHLLDHRLIFEDQSYTLFAVVQSIRSSDTRKSHKNHKTTKGGNDRDVPSNNLDGKILKRLPTSSAHSAVMAHARQRRRLDVLESKMRVTEHWKTLELATDRSLDDSRPCDGRKNIAFEAYATVIEDPSDAWPACVTALSRHRGESNDSATPAAGQQGQGQRRHCAVVDATRYEKSPALRRVLEYCFENDVVKVPSLKFLPEGEAQRYGALYLFALTNFDKIVHVAPGGLFGNEAATLFDRPGLSARRVTRGAREVLSLDLLVVVPDLRLSFKPLLEKLKTVNTIFRRRYFKHGVVSFLNFAMPKWYRNQLPDAFYLDDDATIVDLRLRDAAPWDSDPCCRQTTSTHHDDGVQVFWRLHYDLIRRILTDRPGLLPAFHELIVTNLRQQLRHTRTPLPSRHHSHQIHSCDILTPVELARPCAFPRPSNATTTTARVASMEKRSVRINV